MKITPREKGETRRGERAWALSFLSHRRVSPFSRGVILTRACVSLALLSLREMGTTRSLRISFLDLFHWNPRRTRILCDKIRLWILRSVCVGWGKRGGLKEAARFSSSFHALFLQERLLKSYVSSLPSIGHIRVPRSLYQIEVKCSAFDMEIIFHSHANKTHFHKKGSVLGLTRKWPIISTDLFFASLFKSLWVASKPEMTQRSLWGSSSTYTTTLRMNQVEILWHPCLRE